MAMGKLWAGKIYGTNTGNIFIKLEGDDDALRGRLHVNETGLGQYVYDISGSFDGNRLTLNGDPATQIDGFNFGQLSATAVLNPQGSFDGEWSTTIGSAGAFVLFPHDRSASLDSLDRVPDQLHTARHRFGAIEIDRQQIIQLAEDIQKRL